jgi:hypothetical protein
LLDTIVAPKEAFERLRESPTWVLAFVLALLLGVVGLVLLVPAVTQSAAASFNARVATDPQLAQMSAAQLQQARAISDTVIKFTPLIGAFILPITVLVQTLIMLALNAIGKGSGTFRSLWAASCNIAVPAFGLGNVVGGVIAIVRGAASFNTPGGAQSVLPSLAMFLPEGTKLSYFFSAFNPFTIWAAVLLAMAMIYVARAGKAMAWIMGAIVLLIPALFATLAPATH